MTDRRSEHREKTRAAIVAAAHALFRTHGFEATTMDQIAVGAAVSRRTVFRYFPTKDALVFANAAARLARFEAALGDGDGDAVAAVRRACRELGSEVAASRAELSLQRQLVATSPALLARERDLDRAWEAAIHRRLSQGPEVDEVRAGILAGAVMGAVRATLDAWFAGDGRADLVALGAPVFDLLLPPR